MNGMNYKYIKNGKKTIVFLHGWGLDSNSFDCIINNLNHDFSILKIDLYGFGGSEEPKDYYDTFEYAYQVFLLLMKLGIDDIILVGHSFGGRLSILLASVFRLNISVMFLTASAGLNRFNLLKWIRVKKYKILKKLVNLGVLNHSVLLNYGSQDYKNASKCLRLILIKILKQDLSIFAKKIKMHNVYLVWDKKDMDTKFWVCKKLKKLISGAKIITYKYGGHFVAFNNARKFAYLINNNI